MPLQLATLTERLGQLFADPPPVAAACAQAWADAVSAYRQEMPMLRKPWRARDIAAILADF